MSDQQTLSRVCEDCDKRHLPTTPLELRKCAFCDESLWTCRLDQRQDGRASHRVCFEEADEDSREFFGFV